MYSLLKNIHSYWAYLVLLILILGIFNAIASEKLKEKILNPETLRLSLIWIDLFTYSTLDWI